MFFLQIKTRLSSMILTYTPILFDFVSLSHLAQGKSRPTIPNISVGTRSLFTNQPWLIIPPQCLLPKPAENKPAVGTGTQETLRRCMARRKRMFFGLPCLIQRPIVVIIGVMKKESPSLLCAKIAGEMEIKSLVIAGG